MRLIDSVIRSSLSEAVKKSGGLLAFSRRIGVAHSTVLFWLTGKTKRRKNAKTEATAARTRTTEKTPTVQNQTA